MNDETKPHTSIQIEPDGSITASLEKINCIDLIDLLSAKSYMISRDGDRIMHHACFYDGRELEITLLMTAEKTAKLEVFNLSGGWSTHITPEGNMRIGPKDHDDTGH